MIIRDVYCMECGNVIADYWCESVHIQAFSIECKRCGGFRRHERVCNGGIKSRWRYVDFPDARQNPEFYRGARSGYLTSADKTPWREVYAQQLAKSMRAPSARAAE